MTRKKVQSDSVTQAVETFYFKIGLITIYFVCGVLTVGLSIVIFALIKTDYINTVSELLDILSMFTFSILAIIFLLVCARLIKSRNAKGRKP